MNLMPGDDILGSITAMMDEIRSATSATGILLATKESSGYVVQACRSVPRIFVQGDHLLTGTLSEHEESSSLKRVEVTGQIKKYAAAFPSLESDLLTVSPIHAELARPLRFRESEALLVLFSNRPFTLSQKITRHLVELLAIHIEASLSLRRELEGVASKLDDAEARASRDSLTGLLNRRGFAREIAREQARRDRYPNPVTLVIFDLDGLKAINDSYGHEAGDAHLVRFAGLLKSACRTIDLPARLGGDEFAILAPQTDTSASQHMRERLNTYFGEAGISVSAGYATDSDGHLPISELMLLADAKMYTNKRQSRAAARGLHAKVG